MPDKTRSILVIGATGSQGGAVARALARDGWHVRGLTRNPTSPAARALAADGIELVRGDLDEPVGLSEALQGSYGVYLVTDFFRNGVAKEEVHGKRVAEIAAEVGVEHLVFCSVASADEDTGIPHVDSKWRIENRIRETGIRHTIVRPVCFMEDLYEKKYAPAFSWYLMRRVVGPDQPVKWIAVDDIGTVAAMVFRDADRFAGEVLELAGDERSIRDAAEIFTQVLGKRPLALPFPVFLFRRVVSAPLVIMWEWFREHRFAGDPKHLRELHPAAMDMETWLRKKTGAAS